MSGMKDKLVFYSSDSSNGFDGTRVSRMFGYLECMAGIGLVELPEDEQDIVSIGVSPHEVRFRLGNDFKALYNELYAVLNIGKGKDDHPMNEPYDRRYTIIGPIKILNLAQTDFLAGKIGKLYGLNHVLI